MFIAITCRYEKTDKREQFSLNKKFKDIFDKLNITLIPIFQCTNINQIANMCEALILTGSPIHVNHKLYNAQNEIDYYPPYNEEDKLDYELIKAFASLNKPILGICRGIQVLNVYYGGTLTQKIPNHEGTNHNITTVPNTFISKTCGQKSIVNSTHTQCLKDIANGFKVTAISDDNIIEAIEKDNIIGVQWHPEGLEDINFFSNFIKEFITKN